MLQQGKQSPGLGQLRFASCGQVGVTPLAGSTSTQVAFRARCRNSQAIETVIELRQMRSRHLVRLHIKQELRRCTRTKRIAPALLVALTLGAATLLAPATATADPVETTAVVVRVVDGDTIDIRDDNRGRLRIRVLGIFPVKWAC